MNAGAETEALVAELRNHPLIKRILVRLEAELDPKYVFHSYAHTLDVLHEAIMFAALDDRSDREIELLAIAAALVTVGVVGLVQ